MSPSGTLDFVAGDEDLELHCLFAFDNALDDTVEHIIPEAENLLASNGHWPSPTRPLEDVQKLPVGWYSTHAVEPVDNLELINFGDFFAFDGSSENILAVADKVLSSSTPTSLADTSTFFAQSAFAPELVEDVVAVTKLDAAHAELVQLKAALAVENSKQQPLGTPGSCQSRSTTARKRKSTGGETTPPKRQSMTQKGPIEIMWSTKLIEGAKAAERVNVPSPKTPQISPIHLDVTSQPSTFCSGAAQEDFSISPENLETLQKFLNDDSTIAYDNARPDKASSQSTMAQLINRDIKRAPHKQTQELMTKSFSSDAIKVAKKRKATPGKMRHQRTASAISTTSPPSPTPPRHRSIDELLSANFYSLSEQEKTRVLLPMLRNLDPRTLESSLAELPCIKAKGPGHEVRVASAIRNSRPTEEADDVLATELTYGSSPSSTLTIKPAASTSTTPSPHASPFSGNVAHVEASEELGIMRQREALEKAALQQTQAKK